MLKMNRVSLAFRQERADILPFCAFSRSLRRHGRRFSGKSRWGAYVTTVICQATAKLASRATAPYGDSGTRDNFSCFYVCALSLEYPQALLRRFARSRWQHDEIFWSAPAKSYHPPKNRSLVAITVLLIDPSF
jgi:hypothetical protein